MIKSSYADTPGSFYNDKHLEILIAEDDEDDYQILLDAIEENGLPIKLLWVKNGEDALNYLFRKGKFEDPMDSPTPSLIFLDIKMPKKNGLDVAREIKSHEKTRIIPTVILTTSNNPQDVKAAYENGANSFLKKPTGLGEIEEFKKILKGMNSPLFIIP